ncbi:hypothetical protein LOD99_1395 [Oopsacas minuta]|uniref:Small integral membrane protein 15 n=1 Tax=Oopsacas minuta TaxID=111878 RepID=A0AAV7K6S4_9METZ|nr:hypothetical protein LOD99_1395 [Oopsacas minuta]
MGDLPSMISDEVLLNATNLYFSFLPEWCKTYLVYLLQMVIKDPYGFIKSVFILLLPLFLLSAICSYFLLKEMKKDEVKQKNRDKIKQRAQKVMNKDKDKTSEKKSPTSNSPPISTPISTSPSTSASPGKSKKSKKKNN